ncbi:MAG: hypothetical protein K6E27_07115 [Eubacterium sp.]|jgi:amino acid transporter|nr:hypothetical protein [Eubacterium sp.]
MEIAMIYIFAYALLAVILISVITLIVVMIINIKKKKKVGKIIRNGIIVGIVLAYMITIWISSHKSYPLINDWAFLGKDINVIEHKYKTFKRYFTREDGSGYAVLMTEQITGIKMYDAGDYSCYYMEFDKNGKIIKVYCARPFGG